MLQQSHNNKKATIKGLLTSETNEEKKEKKAELLISRIPRDELNGVLNPESIDQLKNLKEKFEEYTKKKIEQNEGKVLSNTRRTYLYSAFGVSYVALGIGAAVTATTALAATSAGVGVAVAGVALVAGATYVHYSNKSHQVKNRNLEQEIKFINSDNVELKKEEAGKMQLIKKDIDRLSKWASKYTGTSSALSAEQPSATVLGAYGASAVSDGTPLTATQ